MRKWIATLSFLCCVLTLSAQSSPAAKNRVAEIKEMYSQVAESKKYRKETELPPDEMVIKNDYMAAGAGPIHEEYHYFYSGDFDEDAGADLYEVFFITYKYNVGSLNYYEELLFDDDGTLAFFFQKQDSNETRYYFDKGKLVHSLVKGEECSWRAIDDELLTLHRYASDMVTSFGLLMNRNY